MYVAMIATSYIKYCYFIIVAFYVQGTSLFVQLTCCIFSTYMFFLPLLLLPSLYLKYS